MKINIITHGFVIQRYDTVTGWYDYQEFIAADEIKLEDEEGNDASHVVPDIKKIAYLPMQMEQPNILREAIYSSSPESRGVTYRRLYDWIGNMNEDQLCATVTVHLGDQDEFFPVGALLLNDAEQEDDRLDDGHPILAIHNEAN